MLKLILTLHLEWLKRTERLIRLRWLDFKLDVPRYIAEIGRWRRATVVLVPSSVEWAHTDLPAEMWTWCVNNLSEPWGAATMYHRIVKWPERYADYSASTFWFMSPADAVAFKLRWF